MTSEVPPNIVMGRREGINDYLSERVVESSGSRGTGWSD